MRIFPLALLGALLNSKGVEKEMRGLQGYVSPENFFCSLAS